MGLVLVARLLEDKGPLNLVHHTWTSWQSFSPVRDVEETDIDQQTEPESPCRSQNLQPQSQKQENGGINVNEYRCILIILFSFNQLRKANCPLAVVHIQLIDMRVLLFFINVSILIMNPTMYKCRNQCSRRHFNVVSYYQVSDVHKVNALCYCHIFESHQNVQTQLRIHTKFSESHQEQEMKTGCFCACVS